MLVARDGALLKRAKHLSTQAKSDELYYTHDEVGYNYRMTNLQAAVGVAQLEQLENFIETKKRNYFHYIKCGVPLVPFGKNIRPNYWFYSYRTDRRDELIRHLMQNKIQTRPVWGLIHAQPMYRDCRAFEIEKAKEQYRTVVNIPCSSHLAAADVERVAAGIVGFA